MSKRAIIIGAGPAGLTAAYELLKRTDIIPIILEKSGDIGGISKTIDYKGNRMDMGPHRFFSKSDRVMQWWLNMMPLEENAGKDLTISYQHKSRTVESSTAAAGKDPDKVMLVVQRLTRIYFLRKFFAYPIQLGMDTLRTLGLVRTIKILCSFLWVRLFPRKPEKSLEDFIINKFGRQLYLLFFKDYTEKVWGVPCHEISAEWGAQRIKGVSLSKAILQALKTMRKSKAGKTDINQKETETSLIEQFLYPKRGPGSLWEEVARQVEEMGGKIYLHQDVSAIHHLNGEITTVNTVNAQTGQTGVWEGDYFFSTMPVQELVAGMDAPAPANVKEVAAGLQYRDFINVGILLKQLIGPGKTPGTYKKLELKDNWIYIQERDVKVGRLMIYNNWGGGMIKDPDTTWIGMEYFCNKKDDLWAQDDEAIQNLAIMELEKMGLARVEDVLDATVRRMEKTYPAYFGTYDRFDEIKQYISQFGNLFLVGRNGMHKYNNADHSMLTAMVAVDNIMAGVTGKDNLWSINTEQEYHEEKAAKEPDIAPEQSPVLEPVPIGDVSPVGIAAASQAEPSLLGFILSTKKNRRFLGIGLLAILIQFIVFKMLYPFPDFFSDSYSYIEAAANNMSVNIWPIGYSKFLATFHTVTHSDLALIAFQYFFLEFTAFCFFFTIEYFYKPAANSSMILFLFLFFNPLFLYLSNYVSSDPLFTALSLLWLTQLLWIIKRPRMRQIYIQAILLFVLFTIRYNAMYYPLIAALAFLLSRHRPWIKFYGISLGVVLILLFVNHTMNKTEEITGTRQFSVFSGWQLANNALYVYPHIEKVDNSAFPTPESRDFDLRVKKFFDTTDKRIGELSPINGAFYIRQPDAPLKKYYRHYARHNKEATEFEIWSNVGSVFGTFGSTVIRKNPAKFAQFYLLPNMQNYFLPPLEKLEEYNLGMDKVYPEAIDWFHWKSGEVTSVSKTEQGTVLFLFPAVFMLVNIISMISLIIFLYKKGWRKVDRITWYTSLTVAGLMLANLGFSVLASPIVLRYQVFPMAVCLSFSLVLVELLEAHYYPKKAMKNIYKPGLSGHTV